MVAQRKQLPIRLLPQNFLKILKQCRRKALLRLYLLGRGRKSLMLRLWSSRLYSKIQGEDSFLLITCFFEINKFLGVVKKDFIAPTRRKMRPSVFFLAVAPRIFKMK
jgi:hypothetical protein